MPADDTTMTVFNSPWALLLTLPAVTVLALTAHAKTPAWTARQITATGSWTGTISAATATAAGAALLLNPAIGPTRATAAAAAAFLAVLAISTDLASRKVPRDIPHVSATIGLAAFTVNASWPAAISLAVTAVALVALPWITRAVTRSGLGFSDIRLLWAFTATTSWWTGPNIAIWSLLGACLLQLTVRALATPLHLGTRVPVPGTDGRTRLELPFAPALCAAFATGTGYAAITGASACAALYAC